jgi:hypothetical protein
VFHNVDCFLLQYLPHPSPSRGRGRLTQLVALPIHTPPSAFGSHSQHSRHCPGCHWPPPHHHCPGCHWPPPHHHCPGCHWQPSSLPSRYTLLRLPLAATSPNLGEEYGGRLRMLAIRGPLCA